MAKNSNYVVRYRRRRENKTNYKRRLEMLKSEQLRFVVRFTNRYVITQISEYHEDGDKILICANSKELKSLGWNFGTKNTSAAYLTAFLCGVKALSKGKDEMILDLGLRTTINKSKIYSALKGAVESGLKIPHSDDVFPEDSRIKGEHINPEISENFEAVKNKIKNIVEGNN